MYSVRICGYLILDSQIRASEEPKGCGGRRDTWLRSRPFTGNHSLARLARRRDTFPHHVSTAYRPRASGPGPRPRSPSARSSSSSSSSAFSRLPPRGRRRSRSTPPSDASTPPGPARHLSTVVDPDTGLITDTYVKPLGTTTPGEVRHTQLRLTCTSLTSTYTHSQVRFTRPSAEVLERTQPQRLHRHRQHQLRPRRPGDADAVSARQDLQPPPRHPRLGDGRYHRRRRADGDT